MCVWEHKIYISHITQHSAWVGSMAAAYQIVASSTKWMPQSASVIDSVSQLETAALIYSAFLVNLVNYSCS